MVTTNDIFKAYPKYFNEAYFRNVQIKFCKTPLTINKYSPWNALQIDRIIINYFEKLHDRVIDIFLVGGQVTPERLHEHGPHYLRGNVIVVILVKNLSYFTPYCALFQLHLVGRFLGG